MKKFLVFSADWELSLEAADAEEAASNALSQLIAEQGTDFNIGRSVAVINLETDETEVYLSVALLQDLGKYDWAITLSRFFSSKI